MSEEAASALTALGLTPLEAEVYAALVARSPATAYRVAQGLGKAAANVYKAVESLERKGAVVVDEGAGRLCRAVAPAELLGRLGREFEAARARAAEALAGLESPGGDERVYTLRTPGQVYAKCRHLLACARRVVLLDLFPEPFAELAGDLEATARRGVRVLVQTYVPSSLGCGVEVVVAPGGEGELARWPGQWLNAVADASGLLLALLHPQGVHQAVWSDSAYLSILYHSGLSSELRISRLERSIAAGASNAELAAELAGLRMSLATGLSEGAAQLWRRFAGASSPEGGATRSEAAGGEAAGDGATRSEAAGDEAEGGATAGGGAPGRKRRVKTAR